MSPQSKHEKIIRIQKTVTAVGTPDAKIIFTKAPFIQYKKILLDKNFKQYLEKIMVSEKILPTGIQRNTDTENI